MSIFLTGKNCTRWCAIHNLYVGGELGLTNYTIKILAVLGEIPPLSVQIKMNANDNNVAPVAVAA